ncbi:hypothetical protein BDZ91DRAFT_67188 [Kalaharituber pfeilii]|nr:hypothetical protein BDZ91DRAFT_67188 [Kalaharituber pfeilii]
MAVVGLKDDGPWDGRWRESRILPIHSSLCASCLSGDFCSSGEVSYSITFRASKYELGSNSSLMSSVRPLLYRSPFLASVFSRSQGQYWGKMFFVFPLSRVSLTAGLSFAGLAAAVLAALRVLTRGVVGGGRTPRHEGGGGRPFSGDVGIGWERVAVHHLVISFSCSPLLFPLLPHVLNLTIAHSATCE